MKSMLPSPPYTHTGAAGGGCGADEKDQHPRHALPRRPGRVGAAEGDAVRGRPRLRRIQRLQGRERAQGRGDAQRDRQH